MVPLGISLLTSLIVSLVGTPVLIRVLRKHNTASSFAKMVLLRITLSAALPRWGDWSSFWRPFAAGWQRTSLHGHFPRPLVGC